jgi:hypothetical protein
MTHTQINHTKVWGFSRKPLFEYDIFNCPTELKGQMTIKNYE